MRVKNRSSKLMHLPDWPLYELQPQRSSWFRAFACFQANITSTCCMSLALSWLSTSGSFDASKIKSRPQIQFRLLFYDCCCWPHTEGGFRHLFVAHNELAKSLPRLNFRAASCELRDLHPFIEWLSSESVVVVVVVLFHVQLTARANLTNNEQVAIWRSPIADRFCRRAQDKIKSRMDW